MTAISHSTVTKGALWTITSFGAGQVIRFATTVALTRLLVPELFGIMVIFNSIKTGLELLSDFGIGQSIVHNKSSRDPIFYNTAWTLQCIRGLILWLIACAVAVPIANFYARPDLMAIIPVASFVLVLGGLQSVGRFLAQKGMRTKRLAIYEIVGGLLWAAVQVALAFIIPTIWSLVLGLLFGVFVSTLGSFFLVPGLQLRFQLSKKAVGELLHFGKWIFFASAIYFASISFDRFYLASVVSFALLGVYGISRSISELLSTLAIRLGNMVVFPFISSNSNVGRPELRALIRPLRLKFLFVAAVGFAFSIIAADIAIKIVFDARYQAAAWMTPLLIIGAWVSTLCSLNESTLLGIGKPHYNALGHALKFGFLLVGLPLGFAQFGMLGSIAVIAASDLPRYVACMVGQIREHLSFELQDLLLTFAMLALTLLLGFARWRLGYGLPFDSLLAT